jgi:hypothetical protein
VRNITGALMNAPLIVRRVIIHKLARELPAGRSQATLIRHLTGSSPSLSTRRLRIRLVAFIAAITLIVALGAYSAHGFGESGHENGHCDLCVHFSGTAGSPATAAVVGKPVLVVRAPLEHPEVIRSARRRVGTQLPRAPPTDSSELV